jgi:cell division septal protein FtsQ
MVVFFLVIAAAALLFGIFRGTLYAGSLFFSRNSHFELKHLDIASDGRLSASQLREYAAIDPGVNLFALDFDAIRRRLSSVPLVESVDIRRELPDTLRIQVTERVAIAQLRWTKRGLPFLIDRHGIVMPATRSGQSLPIIDGAKFENLRPGAKVDASGVRQCLDILTAADELRLGAQIHLDSFDLRYPEFITVIVNGETNARFPHHSAKDKLVRLVSVLQLASEHGRRIKTVDLTPDGRNVPVTYY